MTAPLITSLEQAGEGSRELDIAVRDALLPDETALDFTMKIGFADQPWTHSERRIFVVENYTTSLDAALALASRVLGDDWLWSMHQNYQAHPSTPAYQVTLRNMDRATGDFDEPVSGPTPALALCIAILKATNPKGQPNV